MWDTALDYQLDLKRWWAGRVGQEFGRGLESSEGRRPGVIGGEDEQGREVPLWQIEGAKLDHADPVFVAAEVLDIVEAATPTFQSEAMLDSDLLCPSGFAMFERPMILKDWRGKSIAYRAISWVPFSRDEDGNMRLPEHDAPEGLHLSLYSHVDDPDDFSFKGDKLSDHSLGTQLVLAHVTFVGFGTVPTRENTEIPHRADMTPEQVDQIVADYALFYRQLQVLFRLAQQRIAAPQAMRPPRAARRRALRQGVDKMITVIRLRRTLSHRYEDGEEREVDWRYRWIVRGHWRNQWYPSLKDHRQIWISSFVKGPEDKELRVTTRAFDFVR